MTYRAFGSVLCSLLQHRVNNRKTGDDTVKTFFPLWWPLLSNSALHVILVSKGQKETNEINVQVSDEDIYKHY